MSYLLILAIFWQPIYFISRYLYQALVTKDYTIDYLPKVKVWFVTFYSLVKPSKENL